MMIKLSDDIVEKHFRVKNYIHIDRRKNFRRVENYVTNPTKIANHGFLPLLYYVDQTEKFTGIKKGNLWERGKYFLITQYDFGRGDETL